MRGTFDQGVLTALGYYLLYGLDPGSFGTACLLLDYDLACTKAHAKLKETIGTADDIIANHILLCRALPDILTGSAENIDKWIGFSGLEGAPDKYKALVKLQWNEALGAFPQLRK